MAQNIRRTRKEIEQSLVAALEKLIPEYGFQNLQLAVLLKEADLDHNVFYRNFGSLDKLFEQFVGSYDFWLANKVDINSIREVGDRQFLINLFQTLYKEFENNESMQQIILWELDNKNSITQKSAIIRENLNLNVIAYYDNLFKGSKVDINVVNAILISSVYYLTLHKKVSKFCNVNFDTQVGRTRMLDSIELVVNLIFDQLESNNKTRNAAKRMNKDGISIAKIANYLDITPAAVRKLIKD